MLCLLIEFLLKDQEDKKRAEFEKDQADAILAKLEDERKVDQARLVNTLFTWIFIVVLIVIVEEMLFFVMKKAWHELLRFDLSSATSRHISLIFCIPPIGQSKQEVKDYLQAQIRHKKAEEHVIQQNKRADFEGPIFKIFQYQI